MQDLEIVKIKLQHYSYPVYIGEKMFSYFAQLLIKHGIRGKCAIISTPPVSSLYLRKVKDAIGNDWQTYHYDVPDGEQSKSIEIVNKIYTWLIESNFERKDTIITLGGGVVGDLAGFVAATFLRGINLIHFPTSLLAQVDSSIGGKVGINHELGKNLIGAFHQPKLVFSDISVLNTLPDEEFTCGLGEVIKYGIIGDPDLFSLMEQQKDVVFRQDPQIIREIVIKCVRIKAEIVQQDERETGVRAVLNLGHTFGHALETFYHYQGLKHGQAVLLGIECSVAASQSIHLLDAREACRINNLVDAYNAKLAANVPLPNPEELYNIMKKDKKVRGGRINLILINKIGQVCQKQMDDKDLIVNSFKILEVT